jgi:hypothetical protein
MHQSIATIDKPEFINLQPLEINPLMSKCEIKVLYLGENRNRSCITKEVASEMAKTLRGAPIVGYYKKDKEDFGDHGEQVIIDDEGVKFNCLTVPYGFVSPDAQVWFQKFEDYDDFGNTQIREYLMTTGYLWTGQFEEAKLAIEEGRPHSMELDENTLEGNWSKNYKTNMDFFIINDAIFSKLCILGEDVEPCFEGSSVTAPQISKTFSKVDNNFTKTLFSMINDLKSIYEKEGGEKVFEDVSAQEAQAQAEGVQEQFSKEEPIVEPTFEKKEEEKKEENPKDEKEGSQEEPSKEEEGKEEPKKDEDKKEKDSEKKYTLLEEEYKELQGKYSLLEEQCQELIQFKNSVQKAEKEELIKKFYMLSDEDKKEYVDNIDKYSLDDIEKELSVICYRKKINFTEDSNKEKETAVEDVNVATYSLNDNETSEPAWISAIKRTRDSRNQ